MNTCTADFNLNATPARIASADAPAALEEVIREALRPGPCGARYFEAVDRLERRAVSVLPTTTAPRERAR